MPLLMPAISEEKHWSKTDSGTIMSSFFWGYTLTQVASGFVSDRIGGQKVIIFAGIGWSLTTYFMPQIITMVSNEASVTLVTIVRTLDGAFQGAIDQTAKFISTIIVSFFIFQECIFPV